MTGVPPSDRAPGEADQLTDPGHPPADFGSAVAGVPASGRAPGEADRRSDPEHLPADIASAVAGAESMLLPSPYPAVTRIAYFWPDGRLLHLQSATSSIPGSGVALLRQEHDRLAWFAGRLPVAEIVAWDPGPGDERPSAWLLTCPPPGSPATDLVHHVEVEALIRSLAVALRRFHDQPIDGCPFSRGVEDQLARASARVEAGAVEQAGLAAAYSRFAPRRLYELLVGSRPAGDEDLVVVHGTYEFGAIHLEHGKVSGYADVARAGVADRYVDLAVAARALATTISPEALGPFFVEYGIDFPDVRKVDFYVLLDEFV